MYINAWIHKKDKLQSTDAVEVICVGRINIQQMLSRIYESK